MYSYSAYTTYTTGWQILIGAYFTDETINDTSFGCEGWGEEYNDPVQLVE